MLQFIPIKAYLIGDRERIPRMIVETDAKEVVKALNHECEDFSESKMVLQEIENLASQAGIIAFKKCPRAGNKIANHLARAATRFWSDLPLSSDVDEKSFVLGPSSTSEDLFLGWDGCNKLC